MSLDITPPNPLMLFVSGAVDFNGNFTFSYTPSGAFISRDPTVEIGMDTVTDPTTHQQYHITFTSDDSGLSYGGTMGMQTFSFQIPAEFFKLVQSDTVEYDITLYALDPNNGFAVTGQATETIELFIHGSATPPPPPPSRFTPEQKIKFLDDAHTIEKLANACSDLGALTDPLHPIAKLMGELASQVTDNIDPQVGAANSIVQTALSATATALDIIGKELNPIDLTLSTASLIDKLAAKALEKLADDPPDGNFTTVFQAPDWSFGTVAGASAAGNAFLVDSWKLLQDAVNTLVASERYQGAEFAGDTASQALQNTAFNNALNAYEAQRTTVSADLNAYLTELQSSVADVNLANDNSLANLQTYLKGLANPLTDDPFIKGFIASIDAAAPNLAGVIAGDVQQALTAIEAMQPPALTGSAFALLSASGNQLGSTALPSLLSTLSLDQQTELIYIGYFNRSADGGGFSFWEGQDAHAQASVASGGFGQGADVALTNIANSFAPQTETIALYPFLSNPHPNYSDPTVQAGLTTFIGNVYENLFDRAADSGGLTYWTGQIESGAVGLGAAVLAIANGAQGSDYILLQNKIAVALDFTNLTSAANVPATPALLAEAKTVLAGVDGLSFNDASVTAAEALIAPWIASHPNGALVALVGSTATPAHLHLM